MATLRAIGIEALATYSDRLQAVLAGRKPPVVVRRKLNPEFPLRRLVRCEVCGRPLTGAFCQGRTKRYPRYWCPKKGCNKVSLLKKGETTSSCQRPAGHLPILWYPYPLSFLLSNDTSELNDCSFVHGDIYAIVSL
jgi:hypothetical protein